VGRDSELTSIERALDTITSGSAAVVIEGQAGIGKTTVWQDGTRRAVTRGFRIMACRPTESEAWLSFSGLADLLQAAPEQAWSALPDPQRDALDIALLKRPAPTSGFDHRATCVAVLNIIRAMAQDHPVVIAVDDVQWLDTQTIDVLGFVVRRLHATPVLVLATVRGERDVPLPFGLDQAMDNNRVHRLRLGQLDLWSLYRIVREHTSMTLSRPELLRLAEACGGNPLFAIEIARALQRSDVRISPVEPLPVPRSLADLVADRIRPLPARTRLALLHASALARPTTAHVHDAMGEQDADLFDAAEDGGIVVLWDGNVRFTHPLLSSTIYSAASASLRRAVHRRLAEVVEDTEERARQLALAIPGRNAKVAAALETAARQAQARGALAAAARLWEMAGSRTPAGDQDRADSRTVSAGECLFTAGDTCRARTMLESTIDSMTAGRERAHAMLWLASILYYDDSATRAVALCRRALAEAGDDRLLRSTLHLRASWFAERDTTGRVRDAERAVEILDDGTPPDAPDVLASALVARGYYRFLAGRGIDRVDLARARKMLPAHGRSWECEWARSMLYIWSKSLDHTDAHAGFADKYRRAIEVSDEPAVPHALVHLAEIECWLGRWPQARQHAAEAAVTVEQTGQRRWRGLVRYVTALLDAHAGRLATARESAEQGERLATADDDPWIAVLHIGVLGFIALSDRDLRAADRHLSRADELVRSMGLVEPARYRFHADHVEAVLGLGDVERATELQRRLEIRTAAAPYPWLRIVTVRSRALLRAVEGDLDAAIEAAGQALDEHREAGLPFEYGRSLLVAGQIRRRRKEKLLSREVLLTACDVFAELGASTWLTHARTELDRLGVRRSPRHDLTPTEERVAEMAASGMTNHQVASALFISEKTVEANLSRTFRKLGIRSRRELGNIAPPESG
jgi:DNA-binding CsgD family transcriptional regulator/tetratricopeptide (TPR) repeat protein